MNTLDWKEVTRRRPKWIPVSTLPEDLTNCLVLGGNYAIADGLYVPPGRVESMSGFYLNLGGGKLMPATYVELWMPLPFDPRAKQA